MVFWLLLLLFYQTWEWWWVLISSQDERESFPKWSVHLISNLLMEKVNIDKWYYSVLRLISMLSFWTYLQCQATCVYGSFSVLFFHLYIVMFVMLYNGHISTTVPQEMETEKGQKNMLKKGMTEQNGVNVWKIR